MTATTTRNADALLAEMRETIESSTYDLVFVDYDDRLSDEQVNALVRGDFETLDESLDEWVCDSRDLSAREEAWQLARDVVDRWCREDGEDYDVEDYFDAHEYDVIDWIIDRDESNALFQLISGTPNPLLRIALPDVDEDHAVYGEAEGQELLARFGLADTAANRKAMDELSAEAAGYPESVKMGYLLARVDLGLIYEAHVKGAATLTLTNPSILLENPFAGSGHDVKVEGEFTVPVSDLRTDADQFGYSWDEVCGLVLSYYDTDATIQA